MSNIGSSPWTILPSDESSGVDLQFFGLKIPNVTDIKIYPEYIMNAETINSLEDGMQYVQPTFKEQYYKLNIQIRVDKNPVENASNVPRLYDSIKDEVHERLMARVIELEEENAKLKRKKKK
jgi:hypothetical protein